MKMKTVWVLAAVLAFAKVAHAAVTGGVEGIVVEAETGKPLSGVTVSVTGPALQGEQTEFTDERGHYFVTELPPGEYVVRFYFGDIQVERGGIAVHADKTLQVNAQVPLKKATTKTYHIVERAPTVDVASAQVQTQITEEMVRNAPIAGGIAGRRNYDSVLGLVPGASYDVNPTFSGSIGNENNFLIDGINTTQVTQGFLGTQMTLEFVRETDVITAGYNAEYARATGAVVNVITKSGSNEFHGGAWLFAQPLQLLSPATSGNGEAIATTSRRQFGLDFGFDLGGPIVKDKVWFYVGFSPSFSRDDITVAVQKRLAGDLDMNTMSGSYAGDQIADHPACPSYLSSSKLCPGTNLFRFRTQEISNTHSTNDHALYNWIAKLDFKLGASSNLALSYIGSPTSQGGIGGGAADLSARTSSDLDNIHDVGLHFTSKVLDRKLQLDALLGYHYETYAVSYPAGSADQPRLNYQGTLPLTTFQDVPECAVQMIHGVRFNPCPITGYAVGGGGAPIAPQTSQRVSATLAATYFLKAAGTHALKAGAEFEDAIFESRPYFTGGTADRVRASGVVQQRTYASVDAHGVVTPQPNGIDATTSTFNMAAYLRDSWNVSFIPGLTLNVGLRWEGLQAFGSDGTKVIGIFDNIAPRAGFAYDFTRRGLSKLYANYGRYYEVLPLSINESQFSRRGLSNNISASPGSCQTDSRGQVILGTCTFRPLVAGDIVTADYAKVQPKLQGQFINEYIVGVQGDVGWDTVLGAAYIHRDLGRVIEDSSPDGSDNFIIGNPGADQSGAIADLRKEISGTTDPTKLKELQQTLQLVEGLQQLPKPTRDYDALQVTAEKRLSHRFVLIASYTFSRTRGNYAASLGAPNTSALYDYRELMVNANGPLPNDHPHNFRFTGGYVQPIKQYTLNVGIGVTVVSGSPIDVLGGDQHYGAIRFILPRGSGGRLQPITSADLHLGLGRDLPHKARIELSVDVFNLLNLQQVTSVDSVYTTDTVNPIPGGQVADLRNLRTVGGTTPVLNPNYGQATGYQQPLSMRFGVRATF